LQKIDHFREALILALEIGGIIFIRCSKVRN